MQDAQTCRKYVLHSRSFGVMYDAGRLGKHADSQVAVQADQSCYKISPSTSIDRQVVPCCTVVHSLKTFEHSQACCSPCSAALITSCRKQNTQTQPAKPYLLCSHQPGIYLLYSNHSTCILEMQSALQYVLQQVLTKTNGHAAARCSKAQGEFKPHCIGFSVTHKCHLAACESFRSKQCM